MNRVLVRLTLAALLLSAGCQGLPPSVRSAHREAGAAVERYRAGYLSVATAYVRDLSTLLDDAASSASESELRAKVADGSVKLDDALAVLKADRVRRAGAVALQHWDEGEPVYGTQAYLGAVSQMTPAQLAE